MSAVYLLWLSFTHSCWNELRHCYSFEDALFKVICHLQNPCMKINQPHIKVVLQFCFAAFDDANSKHLRLYQSTFRLHTISEAIKYSKKEITLPALKMKREGLINMKVFYGLGICNSCHRSLRRTILPLIMI